MPSYSKRTGSGWFMRKALSHSKNQMNTYPPPTNAISIAEIIAKSPDPVKAIADLGTMLGRSQMLGPVDRVEIGQVAVMVCATTGMSIADLLRTYSIQFGKLVKLNDAAVAEFRKAGGVIKWTEDGSDGKSARATFTLGEDSTEASCTVEKAQKAGWTRNTKWQTEPTSMLRARVTKDGIRRIAPWIFAGEYDEDSVPDVAIDPATAAASAARAAAAPAPARGMDFGAMSKALEEDKAHKAAVAAASKPTPSPAPTTTPAPAPSPAPASATLSHEIQGQLVAMLGADNLPNAQAWLVSVAWLKAGQSLEELPEKHARAMLAKPDAVKAKLAEFIAKGGAK